MTANEINKLNELKSALFFAKLQRNHYFETMKDLQSVLINAVNDGAKLQEDEITKAYLKDLLFKVFNYQRSLNMYHYYRDEVTNLVCKIEELKNGDARDENR